MLSVPVTFPRISSRTSSTSEMCVKQRDRSSNSILYMDRRAFGRLYGGIEMVLSLASFEDCPLWSTVDKSVLRDAICRLNATPEQDTETRSSHAWRSGSIGTMSNPSVLLATGVSGAPSCFNTAGSSYSGRSGPENAGVLRDDLPLTARRGCDEHRPCSRGVPMMKTLSRSYPPQSRPLSVHFLRSKLLSKI